MQNVKATQLQKCILLTKDEFLETLKTLFGDDVHCDTDYDGIYIYTGERGDGWEEDEHVDLTVEEVCDALSKHFDVEVTSYHVDSCEYVEFWIAYR